MLLLINAYKEIGQIKNPRHKQREKKLKQHIFILIHYIKSYLVIQPHQLRSHYDFKIFTKQTTK